jgi:hypothetical protein
MSKIDVPTLNKFEYPKHFTATNDITGALIKTRTDGQSNYASGWDLLWGKGKQNDLDNTDANVLPSVDGSLELSDKMKKVAYGRGYNSYVYRFESNPYNRNIEPFLYHEFESGYKYARTYFGV